MNWLLIGGAAAVAAYFVFLRGKASSASGATSGASWTLVKDAAPRVPAANGGTVPVWYKNTPVDPSERWAALAKQHAQDPKAFLSCLVVVVVQKKDDPSKKQAMTVEVVSTEAATDGGLTGRVIPDPMLNGQNQLMAMGLPPALLTDDTSWTPAIGTEIAFTPSDTLAFLQP
jgi:hypothetical protein